MITKDELTELEMLAEKGDKDALIEGIKACQRESNGSIIGLFELDDVNDSLILGAMEVLREKSWQIDPIVKMLREKNKSDEVMIRGMEISTEHNKLSILFELENKKGMSDSVMIKLADLLAERGWTSRVQNLLHRPDISDSVRESIEKILEKNKLAGDGVLSETPKNMRRGPADGKKEKGKIRT